MNRIQSLIKRVEHLESIVCNKKLKKVYEGGAAGHMKHIYDYTELTLKDIKNIITNLLSGKVEDITEKLDGMNMQCTMNNNGKVVFVRNKGDLNSSKGGMDKKDIADRWADKEHVLNTYMAAADTITKVFTKIGKKFFNPNSNTKILANCECISEGKTNILMYAKAQVDFHNLWVYTREDENSEWVKSEVTTKGLSVLEKACEDIDEAQLTPKVAIKVTEKSAELADIFVNEINAIFKEAGCSENSTIEDYRQSRFNDICNSKYHWITENESGKEAIFNRWFNDIKNPKLTELKKLYKDNTDELTAIDKKESKKIVSSCMKPLDTFFSRFGNSIISLCAGIINDGSESKVIAQLRKDMDEVVREVRESGSSEMNDTLTNQLNRLAELGNSLNATEGIVFRYGDRLMKCTGSFASVNQILGLRFRM